MTLQSARQVGTVVVCGWEQSGQKDTVESGADCGKCVNDVGNGGEPRKLGCGLGKAAVKISTTDAVRGIEELKELD